MPCKYKNLQLWQDQKEDGHGKRNMFVDTNQVKHSYGVVHPIVLVKVIFGQIGIKKRMTYIR